MTLVVREVRSPREVPARLGQLEGAVDALWMLPDATAVAAGNVEAWFRFSLEQRVPVVTYSDRFLGLGAAASVEADRFEMGRQAGEIAVSMLARDGSGDAETVAPRKVTAHANGSVLKNLGIALPAGGEPLLRVKP
jgi:putative ABC transport system substrate-binding protein